MLIGIPLMHEAMLCVRLLPGRVEPDKFRDENEEGTIVTLKRFKGRIEARLDTEAEPHPYEVTLDLRAGILAVARPPARSGPAPGEGGDGFLNVMGRFLMVPLRSFAARLPDPSSNRAEWLLADPEKALGLLHRVHRDGQRQVQHHSRPPRRR